MPCVMTTSVESMWRNTGFNSLKEQPNQFLSDWTQTEGVTKSGNRQDADPKSNWTGTFWVCSTESFWIYRIWQPTYLRDYRGPNTLKKSQSCLVPKIDTFSWVSRRSCSLPHPKRQQRLLECWDECQWSQQDNVGINERFPCSLEMAIFIG